MERGSQPDTTSSQIEELKSAFVQFSQETERLEKGYQNLQDKFLKVNENLEKTERLLKEKIVELDLITSYLQNLLKNLREGILFINLNGIITTYNRAAKKCLGIPEEQVLLQNYGSLFPDTCFGFSIKEALESFTAPNQAIFFREEREFEVSLSFVKQGPKEARGVIVLLKEVTEIRNLQKQAQLSDRMKELGEMAAFVAHEIRNPLGGILGYASLLKRELVDKIEPSQKVDNIIEGTKRLNRLVEDVLHYARPLKLQLTRCNPKDLLLELASFIQADLSHSKKIKIETDLKGDCPALIIDRQLLYSALLNLLLNALQSMPEGGLLTMGCREEEQKICLTIQDTGKGIESKDLEKIFSPFFTTKEHGTGLGLSEAYKIIQAHQGILQIKSQVGIGTTCLIYLSKGEGTCQ